MSAAATGQSAATSQATPIQLEAERVLSLAPEVPAEATWDLPVTRNRQVERWIRNLSTRRREETRLFLERSGRYAPMIRAMLRERGMPEDLVYLAFVESGYSPFAQSRVKATGMWQFMAGTARGYGLRMTSHLDERRDPLKSTDAALRHLRDLYDQFGSWYLAAAAYNAGSGRVERTLRRHARGARGSDDLFWKIAPHLPEETRNYVPFLLAAGHIAKDPDKYGFTNLEYQEPYAYRELEVAGGTYLSRLARRHGIELRELKQLNPHLVLLRTPPGGSFRVRLPLRHDLQASFRYGPSLAE